MDPSSELHRGRDIDQLKKHVSEVEALITEIGTSLSFEVASDLALGVKGIVTLPQPPKRKPKPKLVNDENDTYMDEEFIDDQPDEASAQSEASHSVLDVIDEPVVVATGGYSPKEEPVREELAETVKQPLPWVPHDDLVMQSLSWIPI